MKCLPTKHRININSHICWYWMRVGNYIWTVNICPGDLPRWVATGIAHQELQIYREWLHFFFHWLCITWKLRALTGVLCSPQNMHTIVMPCFDVFILAIYSIFIWFTDPYFSDMLQYCWSICVNYTRPQQNVKEHIFPRPYFTEKDKLKFKYW